MKQQDTTDSVRINKDILDKIRQIAKSNGQTIAGYINVRLLKIVDKDFLKLKQKNDDRIV